MERLPIKNVSVERNSHNRDIYEISDLNDYLQNVLKPFAMRFISFTDRLGLLSPAEKAIYESIFAYQADDDDCLTQLSFYHE